MRSSPAKQRRLVERWQDTPIGTAVNVKMDDGRLVESRTRSAPELLGGHTAVIWLEGIRGAYALERVCARP